MARSCRKLLLLAAALAGGAAAAPAPAPPPAQQPINLDAASTEVDGRTNTLAFSDVVISQGVTRVQAEHAHATGLNFANSRWTFDGKVRIDAEQHGSLRSDQATIEFRDNRIARATVTGKPAEFEQQRADSGQLARGHAGEIVYDLDDGTVQQTSGAGRGDGETEFAGAWLVHNTRGRRAQAPAPPGRDQRGHPPAAPRVVRGAAKTEPVKPPLHPTGQP